MQAFRKEVENAVGPAQFGDIAERLAARGPNNAQWQTDIAVSCSKLGSLTNLPREERRTLLLRGLDILPTLRDAGRLPPAQDWIAWFEQALGELNAAPVAPQDPQ